MAFTHALTPITINKTEIKNRIFRSGHGTYLGRTGVTDALIAYHEERAKTGIGLSTLEVVVVHPTSASNRTVYGWDDSIIPGYRDLSTAVHNHGMKMFAQMWHGGHHWPGLDGIGWSPSNIPSPWGPVPLAMTDEMIEEIVNSYAAAALRAREGGLDGVEMHFGHGYLVQQFFSPFTNDRTDRYGGSLENRARFGREILKATRKAVGDDFPIGIRISDSNALGGLSIGDASEIVHRFATDGLIDFVNGSMGSYHSAASMLPAMETPVGAMMPAAGPIVAGANDTRQVVRMVAGRFQTIEEADQLIRDDQADMVAIVRAMIADPQVFSKTLAGRGEDVRPCIGCNQGCIGGIMGPLNQIGCTVNPAVGFERTLSEDLIRPSETPKKVVVVGGGPAGMEAARLAAMSGHRVVLFEAQPRLGGAINIAKRAPNLTAIGDITLWLEREIFKLGVDVRLATYAERDEIRAENPDVVIMATGSIPRMDGWQSDTPASPTIGVDQPHVYSSYDIFDVPVEKLGKSAVVYDDSGHWEAVAVAEYLIKQGLAVTFIARQPQLAPGMAATTRVESGFKRLSEGDFDLNVRSRIVRIDKNSVEMAPVEGNRTRTIPADTVVLITRNFAATEVHQSLNTGHNEPPPFILKLVGDAKSPRDLQAAIADGHMAGRFVEA